LIERPPANSSRNLHLCALCVSAVEFSDSLRPTSVVPNTHYPSQRHLLNPFAINPLHTLDGGCITPQWRCPHDSDPLEYLSHVPYLLYFQSRAHSFLHFFALPKNSTLLFSSDSALCFKKHNHRGWGKGYVSYPQVRAVFLEIQRGQSGQLSLGATARQSRVTVTNHFLSEPFHLHAVTGVLESE